MSELISTAHLLSEKAADAFVADWIDSWNAHDPERILAHYHPEVVYSSPFVAQFGDPSGRLVGRAAVDAYIRTALSRLPDLHFEAPRLVGVGVASVTIHYRSRPGLLALETLVFDGVGPGGPGLVNLALCHYREG